MLAEPRSREGEKAAQGGIVSLSSPDGADLQPRPWVPHGRELDSGVAEIGDALAEQSHAIACRDQGQQAILGAIMGVDVHARTLDLIEVTLEVTPLLGRAAQIGFSPQHTPFLWLCGRPGARLGEMQRLAPEGFNLQGRIEIVPANDPGAIDLARQDSLQELGGAKFGELQPNGGMLRPIGRDDVSRRSGGERPHETQPQSASAAGAGVARLRNCHLQNVSRSPDLTHKGAAGRRQLNAMGVALEQGDAKAIFEITDATAYRGLLDFQLSRGSSEAGRLGDDEQGAQLE